MQRVTSLEPRTPHQPGKLQKLSKNDYVSTLFIFTVNENCGIVSAEFSMECRWFTGRCSGVGAVYPSQAFVTCCQWAIFADILIQCCRSLCKEWDPACENLAKAALDGRSLFFLRTLRPFSAASAFQGSHSSRLVKISNRRGR